MATVTDDEVLVGKVFNFISSKGFSTFADLRRKHAPLAIKHSPKEAASWIRYHLSKDKRFAVQEHAGRVTSVKIMAKVRLCFQYLEDGMHDCNWGGCKYWHVCKDYIEGNCEKQCRHGLSHDFHDEENSDKCEELGFGKLNNGNIKRLVALNSPVVCPAYLQGSCDDPNCSNLHLCAGFVRRSCSDMRECNLSHNLRTGHNKFILGGYNLNQNIKEKYVLCNILVPKMQMAQDNPTPSYPAQSLSWKDIFETENYSTQMTLPNFREHDHDFSTKSSAADEDDDEHRGSAVKSKGSRPRRRKGGAQNDRRQERRKDYQIGSQEQLQISEGHVHEDGAATICSDFILGQCKNGPKCSSHHCSLPYQWQFKDQAEKWQSFAEVDNENLERFYCDPGKNDQVKLQMLLK